jgi:hypothetical protein
MPTNVPDEEDEGLLSPGDQKNPVPPKRQMGLLA